MFFSRPSLTQLPSRPGINQFIPYGPGNFVVLFLTREKEMALKQVAIYYALVVLIGARGAARVIDRLTRIATQAYALVPATSLALPSLSILRLAGDAPGISPCFFLSARCFCPISIFLSMVTLVHEEAQPHQCVMSGGLLLLVINFIGLGLGPTYVGAASDFFHATHPKTSLQIALYTLALFNVLGFCSSYDLRRALFNQRVTTGVRVQ